MDNNCVKLLTVAALALATGCVTAGTWVNGCYIDGPLCTVCDGHKFIVHAYGTAVCTHCDGTGIEPPEETVVVENVIVDTWCPPPRYHRPHHPIVRPIPPRHVGPRHEVGHNRRPAPHKAPPPKAAPRPQAAHRQKATPAPRRPAAPSRPARPSSRPNSASRPARSPRR